MARNAPHRNDTDAPPLKWSDPRHVFDIKGMARKRYKFEEVVAELRQVDVLVSQGQNMVDAIHQVAPRGTLRCVERCCPNAAQARRSETCSCTRTFQLDPWTTRRWLITGARQSGSKSCYNPTRQFIGNAMHKMGRLTRIRDCLCNLPCPSPITFNSQISKIGVLSDQQVEDFQDLSISSKSIHLFGRNRSQAGKYHPWSAPR
jgi:hypothetical protein